MECYLEIGFFSLDQDCTDTPQMKFRALEQDVHILTLPIEVYSDVDNYLVLMMRADCSITTPYDNVHRLYVEATAFDGYFNDSSYEFEVLVNPRIAIIENKQVEYKLLSAMLGMNLVFQDLCTFDFTMEIENGMALPDFISYTTGSFPIELYISTTNLKDLGWYNVSLSSYYYDEIHSHNISIEVINPGWNYHPPKFIQQLYDLEVVQT